MQLEDRKNLRIKSATQLYKIQKVVLEKVRVSKILVCYAKAEP